MSENGEPACRARRKHSGVNTAPLDPDACYRALLAKDARFDGLFFVGVTTTGIYCRPVCRARTPGRARCVFYPSAAVAEREGFRACFRCRPELAPGSARVDAMSRIVAAAVARIDEGALADQSLDDLARELGVTSRHLRRAMNAELGVSPIELAQSRRLALAKQLLHDTALSMTEVALSSGFGSIRRFNAAFRARFGRAPATSGAPTRQPPRAAARSRSRSPTARRSTGPRSSRSCVRARHPGSSGSMPCRTRARCGSAPGWDGSPCRPWQSARPCAPTCRSRSRRR